MADERRIKLTREAQTMFVIGAMDGFRMRVTASEANKMPNEVFLYRRRPLDPNTGTTIDEFISVASSVDVEEYPTFAPLIDENPPFFRMSVIDLVFRAQTDAEDVWLKLQQEVLTLVESMDASDVLSVDEEVWCGPPP